jgi:nucleoside-diphosphate-sugar epimerase
MAQSPRSPYAVAKLAGEQYARTFHEVYGLETVALRYFNIFGPRQDPTSQYSAAIPIFITHAFEGRSPTIYGNGEQTRDFTFVDNAVYANLRACRAPAENVAGETFNVGCGERISVNQLWGEICDAVGTQVEPEYGPTRAGDVRDSLASLERSRGLLGYEVQVDLAEGLRRTVDWFRPEEA